MSARRPFYVTHTTEQLPCRIGAECSANGQKSRVRSPPHSRLQRLSHGLHRACDGGYTRVRRSVPLERDPVQREPVFNVPRVVVAILALLVAIHALRAYLLTEEQDLQLLLTFAFIPARYDGAALIQSWPGGFAGDVWTFVTYSLLHASWLHLCVNAIWFLPFGSALARRFGSLRFGAFLAVTAAAGAALHLASHAGEQYPMIGASAAVSGTMAAAMRFAFQRGGPLAILHGDEATYHVAALPLLGILTDARVLLFLLVWFGINFLFGVASFPALTGGETVAWQAHVGGFLAGLLLFSWFDPVISTPERAHDLDARRH